VSFGFEAESSHVFGSVIKLPRLDEIWPLDEAATEVQTISTDEGLGLSIAAGALQIAPFAPSELQLARVPVADAPDFVPDGLVLVDLFALHPILSTLDPPASISFPADSGLPVGTRVQFYALDYELGQLVAVATGTVDEGGRPASDSGQGIPELTWIGLGVMEEE
jgi:hypothetical protein